MTELLDIHTIVQFLVEQGVVERTVTINNRLTGTTDGRVFTLAENEKPKYVLKIDHPQSISYVEQLHQAYLSSPLLPKLIYIDPDKQYIVYTYIAGTTHANRGAKVTWLTRLVHDLLNHYEKHEQSKQWGRLETPRESWQEFNQRSLHYAERAIGSLLPAEDHESVKAWIGNLSDVKTKYLLHGDTGIHNFVFQQGELAGVIDPSPILGPITYDFTYAFCSSPDDLNRSTLFAAFDMLNRTTIDRSRLIQEVTFQLYCRIGICSRVHPQDLNDYLNAWDHWKREVRLHDV
ncbi:phosphotransferase [Paenibacillus sp. NPDC056579]|uniref:phosphotransferase n=1 Tax=Paenibacillus sp. NPDC056579 TaxID=3345871 RepID=UPI0036C4907F